ncbi:MAG: tetratricopeptide repeat protein [Bacteroidia bacterium]|jgi:tetratricopeptide (TPR) repeat protein|nr:tetratricopeptide repeat protein [Bacteroidia bacterium]
MKHSLIVFAAALLIACNGEKKQDATASTETYKKLYEKSMKIKDLNTAITAIQMILLTDSTNSLRDSLPELYGAVNNVEACMQTNEETLKRYPNEEKFLNIKVLCLQQIGDLDGQFVLLEKLYTQTKKPQYIAQMASLQLAGGQPKEAMKTIDFMIGEFASNKTDSLDIFLDEVNKQKVPVLAAAYNMKGYVYMQRKDIKNAKEMYFKALEIYPDFEMPKRNLEAIFARKFD